MWRPLPFRVGRRRFAKGRGDVRAVQAGVERLVEVRPVAGHLLGGLAAGGVQRHRQLRVHVLDEVDGQCLGRRRLARGTVLRQAVVREDDVVQHLHERAGQRLVLLAGRGTGLVFEPERPLDDVPHEPPAVGVVERAFVGELPRLGQVVHEDTQQHQLMVEQRVKRADEPARLHRVERVLQQPADVRMVEAHRGRGAAEVGHQPFVVEVGLGDGLQVRVGDVAEQLLHAIEHRGDVLVRRGQEVGHVVGARLGRVDTVDDQLQVLLVVFDATLDVHEAGLGQVGKEVLRGVPHPGVELAGAVRDERLDEVLPCAGGRELLVLEDEDVVDEVAGGGMGKEEASHGAEAYQTVRE